MLEKHYVNFCGNTRRVPVTARYLELPNNQLKMKTLEAKNTIITVTRGGFPIYT